jgi:hypothetical protein
VLEVFQDAGICPKAADDLHAASARTVTCHSERSRPGVSDEVLKSAGEPGSHHVLGRQQRQDGEEDDAAPGEDAFIERGSPPRVLTEKTSHSESTAGLPSTADLLTDGRHCRSVPTPMQRPSVKRPSGRACALFQSRPKRPNVFPCPKGGVPLAREGAPTKAAVH